MAWQERAHLGQQLRRREWLRYKVFWHNLSHLAVSVSGHIQDGDAGADAREFSCQLDPAHSWHHDIADEQGDLLFVPLCHSERLATVGCDQHRIAMPLENLSHVLSQGEIIFGQENGFGAVERLWHGAHRGGLG
jgi:hypothetical protein